jgi:PAS domain S-box-containing protein
MTEGEWPETVSRSANAVSQVSTSFAEQPSEFGERHAFDQSVAQPNNRAEGARIRGLLETLPGMFSVASADGQLEYISEEFLELVGVSLAEMKGTRWVNYLHPDDAKGVVEEWIRRTSAGFPFQYYYRVRTREGVYKWFQSLVKPLRDNNGNVVKFYGCLCDVNALRESDELLRQDSAPALRPFADSVPAFASQWSASSNFFGLLSAPRTANLKLNAKARIANLSLLAALALEQLQLISASRLAGEALSGARSNGMNESVAAGSAATILARVQYELGDLDRAERLVLGHLSFIRAGGAVDVAVDAYAILSRIAQHRGRFELASAMLNEGKAVGEHGSQPRLVLMTMAERVRMCISRHEIAHAHDEFAAMESYTTNLRSSVQSHSDAIGQVLNLTHWRLALADGRAAEAVSPFRALCQAARSAQRRYTEFALTLELSGALDRSGEHESAESLLLRALQRSERYGLFQCWVDAGSACRAVLARLSGRIANGASAKTIARNAFLLSLLSHENPGDPARRSTWERRQRETRRLSSRECAVLALIAKGQSNKHVAQTLRITPETVKSHLKRIFMKLQSKTRAEAVARATELGLLAGTSASTVSC